MDGPGDIEERLVDRDALDQRREVGEDGHHLIGQTLVLPEMTPDEGQPGAEPFGPPAGHARDHAERLRLVRGGEDDPTADRDGPAAKRRVEKLLDRGIEGVEVGVQDGGLAVERHRPDRTRMYVRFPPRCVGRSAGGPL